jgi:hypothetical protein
MSRSFRHATILVAVVLAAGSARAQVPAAFSAQLETTFTMPNGRTHQIVGHLYRSADGKTREDSPRGSVIIDPTRGTVTLLTPASKEAVVIVTFEIPSGYKVTRSDAAPSPLRP